MLQKFFLKFPMDLTLKIKVLLGGGGINTVDSILNMSGKKMLKKLTHMRNSSHMIINTQQSKKS